MKIFSHRGLVDKQHKENTLEAFKHAQKNNYKTIEFDVWFFKNHLVLHHDRPESLGNLPKLEDLFSEFKNKFEYWIDFKNLSAKNCDAAIKAFKKITDDLKIKPTKLYFAPFITDLKKADEVYKTIRKYFGKSAQILAVREKLEPEDYQKFYKELKSRKIYGLSIQYKNITLKFRKIFHDIKIFAWTVDSQKVADLLSKIKIENICSDKIKPTKK